MKGSKSYWIAQGTGWSVFLLANVILTTAFTPWNSLFLLGYLNVTIAGLTLSHIIRYVSIKRNWSALPTRSLILRTLLTSLIVPMVWFAISVPINMFLYRGMEGYQEMNFGIGIAIYSQFFVIIFLWQALYMGVSFFRNYKKVEIDKWRLEASLKDAELIALKAQINPHFLFNSLNNIRALVLENPEVARDVITQLSELLRYTVKSGSKELVTLEEELQITKHYLSIEKIHFEDRMKFSIDVDEGILGIEIPPMSIQILAENAIKHGISQLAEGGEISLSVKMDEDLVIKVENTGSLRKSTDGTGLKNALDRIKMLCSPEALFDLSTDGKLVTAQIIIPRP